MQFILVLLVVQEHFPYEFNIDFRLHESSNFVQFCFNFQFLFNENWQSMYYFKDSVNDSFFNHFL